MGLWVNAGHVATFAEKVDEARERRAFGLRRDFGFVVEPCEPRGGIDRFDRRGLFGVVYVGLRSQSLADPTLNYSALSGRRALSWS